MPPKDIAIVGAGLAGLACAKTLAAYDVRLRLFDKGRSPGGRMATRRVEAEGQVLNFDHGAQYLTAHGAAFAAALDAAHAQEWPDAGRRVGVPRMSSVPRALAEGMDIDLQRQVTQITGGPGAWYLHHLDARLIRPGRPFPTQAPEREGPFDAVVLAMPAPQAGALLAGPAPHLAAVLEVVRFEPCWALMLAFPQRLDLPDAIRLESGPIGWAARDSSKPGRDANQELWVVQGGPAWSREHLELEAEQAGTLLLEAFARHAGGSLPAPFYKAAHRWRHALVEVPLGAPCLWDASLGLGATGDWCIGARAEAAVDSAAALVAAIRSS
ncbi:NAD(P)/FAD-dependent oxidoreductase [Falsiroseomonas selenitidurans]|uniref:NAD(P)-binding protein n=1 Tax=Falsiroseomonas selenitidurans TaxID=2716335 RepID=A0ABX1E3F1_9PROT|nr:NAD(P)-binding protein [Falsiroseomonas selenitidurans]NKC30297.1 NAD(P)-binding protein [Falsiroseomonas selenitidurans]